MQKEEIDQAKDEELKKILITLDGQGKEFKELVLNKLLERQKANILKYKDWAG
jgi:hypothetical protein